MAAPKTKEAPRAYLIAGDDDFRKHRELESLLAELVAPDFADFDLEQLDGKSAVADRVMAGLGIPPFSSPRRVVLVKYANKMDEEEQKKLAKLLDTTPSSGCLVMISPAPEREDGKPKKGSEVVGDLSRAIRKVGKVIRVGEEKPKEKAEAARVFSQELFKKAGKRIDGAALARFIQRVGSDLTIVNSEIAKLLDYVGEEDRIAAADIDAVTSETPEEKVWNMIDAIGAKRPAEAMRLLDELFETADRADGEAVKILSNIARQFRLLWQAKLLTAAGLKSMKKDAVPENLRALLPSSPNIHDIIARQYWQEERLRNASARWSRADMMRCFLAIAKTDAMLKGIEGEIEDPRMAMEMLVLDLAR